MLSRRTRPEQVDSTTAEEQAKAHAAGMTIKKGEHLLSLPQKQVAEYVGITEHQRKQDVPLTRRVTSSELENT
ncbi:hypothetical protein [Bradyrhizobium sp. CCGUVB23]|uniref:hypothetical protein n=1 Tax=Bradyrhizobium sp. CCGUVB23 TaxID=2949630 RepID=UPI0020B18FD2|nr:hypothetical protein [Bradyrhizobium sp. CCGUVB23]MCP3459729.1 hypothetical protein [Bradyrhizobium sp. CCGUVB23]